MNYPSGSLDLARIQKALYDWLYNVTLGVLDEPEQIIWRNQSEPLPSRPCVTMKFVSGPSPIARDGNLFLGDLNKPMNVGMQMEATLSIQVFGNTQIAPNVRALQIANDLNTSLLRQSVKDTLKQGGVSIQGLGKVQNLTALEESRYEERAGFEVELGMVQNLADMTSTIETVNITGHVGEKTVHKQIILP